MGVTIHVEGQPSGETRLVRNEQGGEYIGPTKGIVVQLHSRVAPFVEPQPAQVIRLQAVAEVKSTLSVHQPRCACA